MDAESIQKKLDCYALTAKVSKKIANEIKTEGKISCDNELSKETLASILRIKRTEERILTRLDYWVYGQLWDGKFQGEKQMATAENEADMIRKWDVDLNSSTGVRKTSQSEHRSMDKLVARSLSAVKPRGVEARRRKPWKTGGGDKEHESISMFAYNPKSGIDDDTLSTGQIIRRRVFSKFGTLNKKKFRLFFTKGNDDEISDNKSRKSVKSQKLKKESDETAAKVKLKSPFLTLRKKNEKQTESEMNSIRNLGTVERKAKSRSRPKSMVSYDFDFDNITVATSSSTEKDSSLPEDEETKRKTFRERLRSMPIFYVPSSKSGHLKVFK